jgi:hypothetical protein
MVWDFFANLGRQRVNAAQAKVKGKIAGVQAKAKSKAAAKVNNSIDGAGKKAKAKAQKAVPKKKKAEAEAKKAPAKKKASAKPEKMAKPVKKTTKANPGGGVETVSQDEEASFGDKTQFIQVIEEGPKECVGWIVALGGGLKGQDFRLTPGKNVIGTAADCDVVLTDQFLSGRHAVIRYEEGRFTLVDLDSTNGTFVNDERVTKEELIDNDRIRLARSDLKFKALY